MKLYKILLILLLISCNNNSNIELTKKETIVINKAIEIIKQKTKGIDDYYACDTFIEINYEKLKCENTEDLKEKSKKINLNYLNKNSNNLSDLSTCLECQELYLVSGFNEKYLYIEYVPEGYNLSTRCSKNYYYCEMFLFNISSGIPKILCETSN